MAQQTDIHLYTNQTPNGIKISILLEELGLKYQSTIIDVTKNTQKEPWFLEINPNGRIPALTDKLEDGQTINLFESGSIMQYLVDRYDKDHKLSYPYGSPEHWEVNNWLFWQMGGLGPMQGQLAHFNRYASEKIQYGVDRYRNETRRLYRVMETQLQKSPSGYLVGDRCTVADISCWSWVAAAAGSGVDITEFPALKEWRDKLLAQPGVEKGRHAPGPHKALEYENMPEEEAKKTFEHNRRWVQAAMKGESK
ncbi:glutathione S-transferase domain-containing protein [Apiospora rasikravindrae]|uniref:Glutathione S-transferase domain-containing protein n=1 Tax=Apiospora rasikravindrae TaxID=990691 RepID=A0ABR1RSJ9_9PEZI